MMTINDLLEVLNEGDKKIKSVKWFINDKEATEDEIMALAENQTQGNETVNIQMQITI